MSPKRLSDLEKQHIAECYQRSGETITTIAKAFEISTSTVSRVLKAYYGESGYEALVQQKRSAPRGASATPEVTPPQPQDQQQDEQQDQRDQRDGQQDRQDRQDQWDATSELADAISPLSTHSPLTTPSTPALTSTATPSLESPPSHASPVLDSGNVSSSLAPALETEHHPQTPNVGETAGIGWRKSRTRSRAQVSRPDTSSGTNPATSPATSPATNLEMVQSISPSISQSSPDPIVVLPTNASDTTEGRTESKTEGAEPLSLAESAFKGTIEPPIATINQIDQIDPSVQTASQQQMDLQLRAADATTDLADVMTHDRRRRRRSSAPTHALLPPIATPTNSPPTKATSLPPSVSETASAIGIPTNIPTEISTTSQTAVSPATHQNAGEVSVEVKSSPMNPSNLTETGWSKTGKTSMLNTYDNDDTHDSADELEDGYEPYHLYSQSEEADDDFADEELFETEDDDEDVDEDADGFTPRFRYAAQESGVYSSNQSHPIGSDFVTTTPLAEAILPKICYLVVDRSSELIARPLREFSDLGEIPSSEFQERTLPIFDNHRVARRYANRSQRVMKIPDSQVLQKTGAHLQAKGITRILVDGKVYSL